MKIIEEEDRVKLKKGISFSLTRRKILVIILIIIILVFSYWIFLYGKDGELALYGEILENNIPVNTTFSIKCTLENIGQSTVRITPYHVGVRNFEYPNGSQVPYNGPMDGVPVYSTWDLITLNPGEKLEKTIPISHNDYKLDVPGNYTLQLSYCSSDYGNTLFLAHWEGVVTSQNITVSIL